MRHGLASSLSGLRWVVSAAWRGQRLGVEQIRDPVTGGLLRLLLNLMLLLCYHLLLLRSKVLRLLLDLMLLLLWYYLLLLGGKVLELRNVGLRLMLLLLLQLLCCWSRGFVLFRRRSYRGTERGGGGGGG